MRVEVSLLLLSQTDPQVTAALVAAVTSIVVLVLGTVLKTFLQKHFYLFKLEHEHRYEQRKKLKEILSRHKVLLLNSCELLNHRLWNLTKNYSELWHAVDGDYENTKQNYFASLVWRFAAVLAWIRVIQQEMIYLDTTIAGKKDLDFVKFLHFFPQIMSDLDLFKGLPNDKNIAKDHFFRNDLDNLSCVLIADNAVLSYEKFTESYSEYTSKLRGLCQFMDGISPVEENRLRWDRLQAFHLTLMAFLNSFGYDFQYTSRAKVKTLLRRVRPSKISRNFQSVADRHRISSQREMRMVLRACRKSAS